MELLRGARKFYPVDLGMRKLLTESKSSDMGFAIESLVYFELLRRNYRISIGRASDTEIDFVTKTDGKITYIQVSVSVLNQNTFKREMAPLLKVSDRYTKIILTLDRVTTGMYETVEVKNLIDWLCEPLD